MKVNAKVFSAVVYIVMICMGTIAVIYVTGSNIQPRVQLSVKEVEWKNQTGSVIFRFESKEGVFTAGEPVHVQALLFYHISTNESEPFLLYFPNTLSTEEYEKLSKNEQWQVNKTDNSIKVTAGYSEDLHNFVGIPPYTEFDTIWTQEGLQDGYMIFGDTFKFTKSGQIDLSNGIKLEKIINIQPTDVLQNVRTNNTIAGLTFALILLTMVTVYVKYDRFGIRLSRDG